MRWIDLTGQKFNRLLALEYVTIKSGVKKWRCLCDCGNETAVSADKLKSGYTRSCGCLLTEAITKHGHNKGGRQSRTYKAWSNMHSRVDGVTEGYKKSYTDRGITICEQWRDNFPAFLADMGECPPGLTLDRIDNDGNYELYNVVGQPRLNSALILEEPVQVLIGDNQVSLKEACAFYNIPYLTAMSRIKRGMTTQEAIDVALAKPGMPLQQRKAIANGVGEYWRRMKSAGVTP